jgi:hypothetical protein
MEGNPLEERMQVGQVDRSSYEQIAFGLCHALLLGLDTLCYGLLYGMGMFVTVQEA